MKCPYSINNNSLKDLGEFCKECNGDLIIKDGEYSCLHDGRSIDKYLVLRINLKISNKESFYGKRSKKIREELKANYFRNSWNNKYY